MSEPKVKRVTYREYAGCYIKGTHPVPVPTEMFHMERAYYLTAMLEAPEYGSVQSYDRAGMSGGPMHNIAVYPKTMQQGSMFPLLRAIELGAGDTDSVKSLWAAYRAVGWFIARDGVLRDYVTGKAISGKTIRDEFTPIGGKVGPVGSKSWDKAKFWAIKHWRVFSDPRTFNAQKEFAIDYLLTTQRSYEVKFYQDMNPITLRVQDTPSVSENIPFDVYQNTLTLHEDLAMCMYHSHSVNAPVPARTALTRVLRKTHRGEYFSRLLIWTLGTYKYGRWITHRYPRTRSKALQSGLWPRSFFVGKHALMPKTLPVKPPKDIGVA